MSTLRPFAILGLDPATCDAAAIKAAYARLVKLHRPDRDPAGFRRVRDAYEFCCSPPGAAIMAAARRGDATDDDATWDDGMAEMGPADSAAPVLSAPSAPAAPAVAGDDLDALVAAWDHGATGPLAAAARRWWVADDWPRLRDLGRRWRERLARLPDAGAGGFALELADLLALYDGPLAGDLLDAGFRLAGAARTAVPDDLDLRLHVGRILARMDDGPRGELVAALDGGGLAPDAARRLRAAFAAVPYDATARGFIAARLPELWPRTAPRRLAAWWRSPTVRRLAWVAALAGCLFSVVAAFRRLPPKPQAPPPPSVEQGPER